MTSSQMPIEHVPLEEQTSAQRAFELTLAILRMLERNMIIKMSQLLESGGAQLAFVFADFFVNSFAVNA